MIVVTRHSALVEYLQEQDMIDEGTPVLSHVDDPAQIEGQHVIGVLPLSLAVLASQVTEIPLALTPDDRGQELDLARVREIAGEPRTYQVYDRAKWERVREHLYQSCEGALGLDHFWPTDYLPRGGPTPPPAFAPRRGGRREMTQRVVECVGCGETLYADEATHTRAGWVCEGCLQDDEEWASSMDPAGGDTADW